MAVDPKLIKKADLARVREIEFTEMFGYSIKKLMEALGVTRKIAKQAGTVLKSYKATGTLEDGAVAEGETIPLSKYKTEAVNYKEITLKKWRTAHNRAFVKKGRWLKPTPLFWASRFAFDGAGARMGFKTGFRLDMQSRPMRRI